MQHSVFSQVLLALAVVIVCARAAGAICRRLHQPPVIGEVLAGILLGPSFLGRISTGVMDTLFPSTVIAPLGIIAQLGVVVFMFLMGVELNVASIRERSGSALAISFAGIVVPFTLGAGMSAYLYRDLAPGGVSHLAFALFLGVSLSVTAFPVLARILTDRDLHRTRLGIMALSCAAVDDATAWCLLAFVVGVVQAQLDAALRTVFLAVLYLCVMFWFVRPFVRRWVERFEKAPRSEQPLVVTACAGLLISSLMTETIGIHALFGAFLFGALIRHDSRASAALHRKLYDFVVVMLLPAFFALTGLRTQVGLVEGPQWLVCGLIIFLAFAGKFGGCYLAARSTGHSHHDASALGILMNTRGLMELIVLNVGLDLGVISSRLFAMMVIMALVTTLATAPILDRIMKSENSPDDHCTDGAAADSNPAKARAR